MLEESIIDVTFVSSKLSKKQIADAGKLLRADKILKSKKQAWKILKSGKIENKKCFGLWVRSEVFSLNSVLLDRVLYWRWYNNSKYHFDHNFLQIKDMTVFYAFCERGLESVLSVQEFLTRAISEKEFETARVNLLKFIRESRDVVNIKKSLDWIGGLGCNKYAELKTNNIDEAYQHYKKLKFSEFESFSDKVLNKDLI